mgnify:CR=1 FL=1
MIIDCILVLESKDDPLIIPPISCIVTIFLPKGDLVEASNYNKNIN